MEACGKLVFSDFGRGRLALVYRAAFPAEKMRINSCSSLDIYPLVMVKYVKTQKI